MLAKELAIALVGKATWSLLSQTSRDEKEQIAEKYIKQITEAHKRQTAKNVAVLIQQVDQLTCTDIDG